VSDTTPIADVAGADVHPAGNCVGVADGRQVVELELPALPSFNAVGRLVVGGVASRLDFEVPDIEDLQLAVEALLWRRATNGTVTLVLRPSANGLDARLGPFEPERDRQRVERMLQRLVQEAVVEDSREGEWIVIGAARERATTRGSS
jgi:hypothetical protein